MVTVDDYVRIRLAHRDGLSVRELARRFHHSRRKIAEIVGTPEPKPYLRLNPPPSVLDPFKELIDSILSADEQAPRKQRHTAAKLCRRLQEEHGYPGSYERVRLYVKGRGRQRRETFIPLDHDPGQRLEADFGHIYADFPAGRQQVAVLITTWGYSNCPFAIALPSERTEAILHGLVEAFSFFGCVPRELWWDNPTTVVSGLLVGRSRQVHARYQALASHYCFEPLFCLVRRPQEKPRVEGRVQFLQQEWATPVPQVQDLAALNVHLRACCLRERERTQAGRQQTIGARLAQDQAQALPLPARPFDAALVQAAKVDKYQLVHFDSNRYSVPRSYAFATVTVKAYVDRVEVVAQGQVVAQHPRCYSKHEQILDPLHYLASLGRRPAALDHANVYRHWRLPALFGQVRQALEAEHGPTAGARQYVRILQLLAEHPLERVERAIVLSRRGAGYDVAGILRRARQLADKSDTPMSLDAVGQSDLAQVQVPLPNLRQFDQLLTPHEVPHARPEPDAGEEQLEATAAADHARRVRETGARGSHGQRELRAVSAAPDRTGSNLARGQRAASADQASGLSGAQGLGQLRFCGHAECQ